MRSIRDIVKARRSCRAYLARALEREAVEALIAGAVWAPSGSNQQPWRFAVIRDRAWLKRYSDLAKKGLLERLDEDLHLKQYERHLRDPEFNVFYDAPVLVAVYGDPSSHWYVHDCTMAAYNLMLLAEEEGLGSCWIGFAHGVLESEAAKRELSVPVTHRLVAPILLGYPDPARHGSPPSRKPYVVGFAGET